MPGKILNTPYKNIGHVLFWLVSIVLWLIMYFYNENRVHFDLEILTKATITNLGFAIGVYCNLYLLIPRFLKQKNYVFYVFWLILLITFSSLLLQFLLIYPLRNILNVSDRISAFNIDFHSAYFFVTFLYISLTSLLKFTKDWLSLQDLNLKIAKIEKQKLEAELTTLKGQLNPHFLFNSLNNIYSLSLIKSDKVPELILKLSDLMRHIIYESREKYISLEKEIEFVNNFIELQKIRTSDNVKIDYSINGAVPTARIAPLLFEPFIDNAFKHGLPGDVNNDFIQIHFDFSKPDELVFNLVNNYEDIEHTNKKNSGIGISNVKQRLKYLYNQKDYSLSVDKLNGVFTVKLKLKLK